MMLNIIITDWKKELNWLNEIIDETDRKHKAEELELSLKDSLSTGLGDQRVEMARGPKFVLSRDKDYANLYRLDEPQTVYRIRLTKEPIQPGDYYHRYKAKTKDLRQVKGLVAHLGRSRVFKSISDLEKGSVYLYRLAYAIANPEVDIYYDKTSLDGQRVEMAHLNRVCCDDRASNLKPMKRWEHKQMDEALEVQASLRRLNERTLREIEEHVSVESSWRYQVLEAYLEGLTRYELLELHWEADAA